MSGCPLWIQNQVGDVGGMSLGNGWWKERARKLFSPSNNSFEGPEMADDWPESYVAVEEMPAGLFIPRSELRGFVIAGKKGSYNAGK